MVCLSSSASAGLLLLGLALLSSARASTATIHPSLLQHRRPYFCGGLDCPDFDVLETSGDVQLRRYASARYVVTTVKADSLVVAQLEGTHVRRFVVVVVCLVGG